MGEVAAGVNQNTFGCMDISSNDSNRHVEVPDRFSVQAFAVGLPEELCHSACIQSLRNNGELWMNRLAHNTSSSHLLHGVQCLWKSRQGVVSEPNVVVVE